jgi:heptosyltransferase-3
MKIPRKVNQVRRKFMQSLTKNIGKKPKFVRFNSNELPEIKRILISRPNGRLGNLLLITPLLQDVSTTFPDCKIDLLVKGGLAPILFENYKNVDKIIQLPKKPFKSLGKYIASWISLRGKKYDLVINVSKNSSSGRLSTQFSNSRFKFFGDNNEEKQYEDQLHIAKYPVYNFRMFLAQLGFENNKNPIPSLDLKLSESEIEQGKIALNEITKNDKKTICIFTYATGEKCYSEEWWENFYLALKGKYTEYNIIEVLPIENISRINFQAPTFYSKDVREIGALIANTNLFIGADSGIMHLASSVHTPTVGLFSITQPEIYEPYNNSSVGIKTCNCSVEDFMKVAAGVMAIGLRLLVFMETQIVA